MQKKPPSKATNNMVQVRRPTTFATQFTFGRHFGNLIILAVVLLCGGFYLILLNEETRQHAIRGTANMGGSVSLGVAHALPVSQLVHKPHLVYGTAWKKEETARLVSEAVKAGFRFIDTACQPKHYNEAGVGNGWTAAAQELGLKREEIWLQTKYTPHSGQDPNNMPYNPDDEIADQVRTSLEVSLRNLHTEYLDSWVMHSPFGSMEKTMEAWRAMEEGVDAGKVRQLGMSNCYDLHVFKSLYEQARVKPSVLQNRFYEQSNFDTDLRKFCKENGIQYQSFWTLTANRRALGTREAHADAEKHGLTPQTHMFAFLMSLGYITPLSGTTSPTHMAQDVAIMERMQGGEIFFHSEEELRQYARFLGMPDL